MQPPFNAQRRKSLQTLTSLVSGAALSSAWPLCAGAQDKPALLTRAIPRTGEKLAVVGLGTQFVLDVGDDLDKRKVRIAMIRTLLDNGGSVIDTAPSYGPAETQLGSMLDEMKARERVFLSTKFRAPGRDGALGETRESLKKLRTQKLDLLLRHNIGFVSKSEADTHLAVAREWKSQGVCRYIGVTHSQDQARANDRLIEQLEALREGAGKDMRLITDLNFNYKTEGFKRMAKAVERFNMMWLEMDTFDPKGLAHIRNSTSTPIGSLEAILGRKALRPYLEERSVDVAIIDAMYNGLPESIRMATMCDAYETNVASHAFAGPLATVMSAHFCAVVPNLRIMEIDVDEVPWRPALLTNPYKLEDGCITLPKGPGWGTDVDEAMLVRHKAA